MYYFKLIIIGFFLAVPTSIFAADISVSSPSSVTAGSAVTLTVAVNSVTDLFSASFDIQYDPSILSFISAQKGTFFEQGGGITTLLTSASNGTLIVGYSRQAIGGVSTGVNGSGNLMTLTFNTLTAGTTNITFQNNALCSSVGFLCTEIPATWNSTSIIVTSGTVQDTTAPTVAITEPASGSTVSGTATIAATATDNIGITGVQFKLDGNNIGNEDTTAPYTISFDTTLQNNGSHTLTATARDASGNSATSNTITIIVTNTTADMIAPTTPVNLSATAVSSSQVNLIWLASTDSVGVTGYRIYRNGTELTTTTNTSYTNTGLNPSTTYTYTVLAYDRAGNTSSQSTSASATTQAPAQTQTVTNTSTPTTTHSPTVTQNSNPATITPTASPVQTTTITQVTYPTSQTTTTNQGNNILTAILPAGCSAGFSFSTTTGQPCTNFSTVSTISSSPISPQIYQSNVTASYVFSNTRPITYGMKNNTDVRELQKILQQEGVLANTSTLDGSFFTETKTAVIKLQQKYGISPAEGYVGPITKKKLNELFSATPATANIVKMPLSFFFSRNLTIGSRGEDVKALQQILNTDPTTKVTLSGAGSPGNETTYFGPVTKTAVIKYQQKQGIVPASGYVGPLTRNKLNNK